MMSVWGSGRRVRVAVVFDESIDGRGKIKVSIQCSASEVSGGGTPSLSRMILEWFKRWVQESGSSERVLE